MRRIFASKVFRMFSADVACVRHNKKHLYLLKLGRTASTGVIDPAHDVQPDRVK